MSSLASWLYCCIMSAQTVVRKCVLVGISGTTNSGKSTLTRKLLQALPGSRQMCQDNYGLCPDDPRLNEIYLPELGHHNWEDYRSLEMDRFVDDVHKMVAQCEQLPHTCTVIFIDGFSILGWKPLCKLFDLKYFLSVDKSTCWKRRQQRDYNPPDVPGYFEKYVWPQHLQHLEAIRDQEDIVYIDKDQDIDSRVKQIVSDVQHLCEQRVNGS